MTLQRPREAMPERVAKALRDRGLQRAYDARPDYQQNDYLRWIRDAHREETKAKRIAQMLDELEEGDVYMKMRWRPGEGEGSRPG